VSDLGHQHLLKSLQVASPCQANWEDMKGTDKVRFCQLCKLNVYNISEMTTVEAEQLLTRRCKFTRTCVRFYRRTDGTVLTQNCPIGLRRLKSASTQLWQRISAIVFWFFAVLSGALGKEEPPVPRKVKPVFIPISVSPKVPKASQEEHSVLGVMLFTDPDLGPYMKDLQNRIMAKWNPPKGAEELKTIVRFKIGADGQVFDLRVEKTSAMSACDEAALAAVQAAVPFRIPPVPEAEIQFTFDPNQLPRKANTDQ